MPYDLSFERISKTEDEAALMLSKQLATALLTQFSEIHELNTAGSEAHFMQFEVDPEDEFPERYFTLWADLDGMHFGFQFWKDTLWLELGAAGNPAVRFAHVFRYARFITQYGFAISGISVAEPLTVEAGVREHLLAYKEWVGFVEQVAQLTSSNSPAPE